MKRIASSCLLVLLLFGPLPAVGELTATFEVVGIPTAPWLFARTSTDGSVIAVNNGGDYYRVEAGVVQYLGFGHPFAWSVGVSGDGTAIMGTMVDPGTSWRNPARWTEADGWTLLGGVPGGLSCDNDLGSGYDLDGDGTKGAGLAWSTQLCKAAGFLWTLEDGMIQLDREANWSSRASAISSDGSTVVGWAENNSSGTREPTRWIDGGALDRFLGPDRAGECYGVSSDGTLICGEVDYTKGMIWSQSEGLTVLSSPSGGSLYFWDIADDATAVGGYAGSVACVRFADGPVQNLLTWLLAHGAIVPAGTQLTSAMSISTDASTIIGSYSSPSNQNGVFVARLSPATSVGDSAPAIATGGESTIDGVFPNPFNPATTIQFTLSQSTGARLQIFDIGGQLVRTLVDERRSAGRHSAMWDGRDDAGRGIASGVYVARLLVAGGGDSRKLLLAR